MAQHNDEGPIAVHSIAERQDLSDRYLEQLMVPLKKAGLVKSIRGAQGGYILARAPKDISVGDVVRALEGPIAPVDCVAEEFADECARSEECVTRVVWVKMRDAIANALDSFSLEDLVAEAKRLKEKKPGMYYI